MPIQVQCPNGHVLVAEEAHIGRKVRCPACRVVMIVPDPNPQVSARPPAPRAPVPQPPAPRAQRRRPDPEPVYEEPPAEEVYDEPPPEEERRPRGGMKTRQRMRLANVGLAFHYAKILCALVAIVIGLLMIVLTPLLLASGSMGVVRLLQVMSCIAMILMGVTPLLGGTGSLLCFWVPAKSRSKVLVIVSFSLEAGFIAMLIVSYLVALGGAATAGDDMMRGRGPSAGLGIMGAGIV